MHLCICSVEGESRSLVNHGFSFIQGNSDHPCSGPNCANRDKGPLKKEIHYFLISDPVPINMACNYLSQRKEQI